MANTPSPLQQSLHDRLDPLPRIRRQRSGSLLAFLLVGGICFVFGIGVSFLAQISIDSSPQQQLAEIPYEPQRDAEQLTKEIHLLQARMADQQRKDGETIQWLQDKLANLQSSAETESNPISEAQRPAIAPRPSPFPGISDSSDDYANKGGGPLNTNNPTLRIVNRAITEYANRVTFVCESEDQTSLTTSAKLDEALRNCNKSLTGERISVHFRVDDVAASSRANVPSQPVRLRLAAGELRIATLVGIGHRNYPVTVNVLEDTATAQGIHRGDVVKITGTINKRRSVNQPQVAYQVYLLDYLSEDDADMAKLVANLLGPERFWVSIPVAIEKTEYLKNAPQSIMDALIYDFSKEEPGRQSLNYLPL